MDVLRRVSFVIGLVGLFLSPVIAVAATSPPEKANELRFAYVYLNDADAANSFKGLLEENGLTVDLVTLDEAPKTDFGSFNAVIAASDVKKAWDSVIAKRIGESKKPVLGLGEGGYYLFERWHLTIGSPNGWHGGEVAIRPIKTGSKFWSTAKFKLPDDQEAVLYAQSSHVGIHLPTPVKGVVGIGRELGSSAHYVIIEQNNRYLLWGFDGSPQQMTTLGKKVFVQACRYIAEAATETSDGSTPAMAQASPSSPVADSTNQLVGPHDSSTTIRIQGDGGALAIKVDGPQITAVVADRGVTIHDQAADRTYELKIVEAPLPSKAPAIEVTETPAGVQFQGTSFQIKREEAAVVTASFEVPSPELASNREASPAATTSSTDLALFLSCGSAGGPGRIYETSLGGEEIAVVPLDAPAYGLVYRKDSLIAAIPSVRMGEGKLLEIRSGGSIEPLELDGELGAPIGLALDHETQDLLVPDNEQHTVLRVIAPDLQKVEMLFRSPLTATSDHFPSMSVAATQDRRVVFSASDPKGVFCLPLKVGESLPDPMLGADVGVAADPSSNRWVAMFANELKVFQGNKEERSIPCADDAAFWHYHVMAFAPDGRLFVVLEVGGALEVQSVDLQTGEFSPQFAWHGEKIISMAAGPAMNRP